MSTKSGEPRNCEGTEQTFKTLRPLSEDSKNVKKRSGRSMNENRKIMALQDALQDPVNIYEGI